MKKVSVDFKFECPLHQLPDLMKKLKKIQKHLYRW